MAGSAGFKVEGVSALVRKLSALGLDVDDLKGAFSSIADEGARVASGFAPKRTGALAADIRGNRAKSKAVVTAGRARVPYAGPINYGWGAKASGYKTGKFAKGTLRGSFGGSLFLQRTDEVMRPKAIAQLEREINKKLKQKGLI